VSSGTSHDARTVLNCTAGNFLVMRQCARCKSSLPVSWQISTRTCACQRLYIKMNGLCWSEQCIVSCYCLLSRPSSAETGFDVHVGTNNFHSIYGLLHYLQTCCYSNSPLDCKHAFSSFVSKCVRLLCSIPFIVL